MAHVLSVTVDEDLDELYAVDDSSEMKCIMILLLFITKKNHGFLRVFKYLSLELHFINIYY